MLSNDDRIELVVALAASMVTGSKDQPIDTKAIANKAWRLLEAIEHHSEDASYEPVRIEKPKERHRPTANFASSSMYRR